MKDSRTNEFQEASFSFSHAIEGSSRKPTERNAVRGPTIVQPKRDEGIGLKLPVVGILQSCKMNANATEVVLKAVGKHQKTMLCHETVILNLENRNGR